MIQRMKWNLMSICLVLGWYWWSFVSAIADWLSEKRVVGSSMTSKSWVIRDLSHSASLEVCVTATYSLSVVDRDMISCHLAAQETAPPFNKNAYPEIACLSSAILPSASAYPLNSFICQPKILHAFQIAKNSLYCFPMSLSRVFWKMGDRLNGIGNIRTCSKWRIHKRSYCFLIGNVAHVRNFLRCWDWAEVSWIDVSMGRETGLRSSKLYLHSMDSM